MSKMSDLSIELQRLQDDALAAAEDLAARLQAISDLHWQGCDDGPMFRVTEDVLDTLKAIELLVGTPISEIQCAA